MELNFSLNGPKVLSLLWSRLIKVRKTRHDQLSKISNLFEDPIELAKYYVIPDCQEYNPADYHEDEPTQIVQEDIFKFLSEYFRNDFMSRDGRNQLFILSDAGMGKTSLLMMLKLLHLTAFFPKHYRCEIFKLGEDTIKEIKDLGTYNRKTILLLDALDEDPLAWVDIDDRLKNILRYTNQFYRVIITCRTQFFPDTGLDPFNRPGRFEYAGYICPAKYLSLFNQEKSLFNQEKIIDYLDRRFPSHWYAFLTNRKKTTREKAIDLIKKMGSLKCRPMLLSYIEDILESSENFKTAFDLSEFNIYKSLIDAWLHREVRKSNDEFTKPDIYRVVSIIATYLQMHGRRFLSNQDLKELKNLYPELEKLDLLHITGRSLLNKNSNGDYRFSHYSIQEFLIADRIINDQAFIDFFKAKGTDNILKIVRSQLPRLLKDRLINVFNQIPHTEESIDSNWLALREMILKQVVSFEDTGETVKKVIAEPASSQDADKLRP